MVPKYARIFVWRKVCHKLIFILSCLHSMPMRVIRKVCAEGGRRQGVLQNNTYVYPALNSMPLFGMGEGAPLAGGKRAIGKATPT